MGSEEIEKGKDLQKTKDSYFVFCIGYFVFLIFWIVCRFVFVLSKIKKFGFLESKKRGMRRRKSKHTKGGHVLRGLNWLESNERDLHRGDGAEGIHGAISDIQAV